MFDTSGYNALESLNSKSSYIYIQFRLDKPKGEYVYGVGENQVKFEHEPFYVGKASRKQRVMDHFRNGALKNDKNKHKVRIIKKLLGEGYKREDIARIYRINITENDSNIVETALISTIGRYDLGTGPLTNKTSGGEGIKGRTGSLAHWWNKTMSEESKEKNRSAHLSREYVFYSPDNEKYEFNNMHTFCKEYDLDRGAMNAVMKGTQYAHKGWRGYIVGKEHLRDKIEEKFKDKKPIDYNKRRYRLRFKNEDYIDVESLIKFGKERSLNSGALGKVVSGKIYHHKGWTGYIVGEEHLRDEIENNYRKVTLISPEKKIYEVENITNFCDEFNLSRDAISLVINGHQKHHKGWTGQRKGKKTFESERKPFADIKSPTGEVFKDITNLSAFCKLNNLSQGCMSSVIHGHKQFHKGWSGKLIQSPKLKSKSNS